MVKDAELNAADDKKKLEVVLARNAGDALLHGVRKQMAEYAAGLEAGEKSKLEAAMKDLEHALKGEDKAAIESRTATLTTASQKLGEKMQTSGQASAGAAGRAGAATGPKGATAPVDDDVVDAEVHDVK